MIVMMTIKTNAHPPPELTWFLLWGSGIGCVAGFGLWVVARCRSSVVLAPCGCVLCDWLVPSELASDWPGWLCHWTRYRWASIIGRCLIRRNILLWCLVHVHKVLRIRKPLRLEVHPHSSRLGVKCSIWVTRWYRIGGRGTWVDWWLWWGRWWITGRILIRFLLVVFFLLRET